MGIEGLTKRRYATAVALAMAGAALVLTPLIGPTLNLAAAYATRVVALDKGHVVADGPPELLRAPDGGTGFAMGVEGLTRGRYTTAVALAMAGAALVLTPLIGPTSNLPAAYATRVVALDKGRVVADGPPELLRAPDGRHWIRYGD